MCKTIFTIIVLLMLSGCSIHEWNKDCWHYVQAQYPECQDKPMPEVFYSDKLEQRGLYYKGLNWVIVKYPNDLQAVCHEFRHACGDDQGELPFKLERIL